MLPSSKIHAIVKLMQFIYSTAVTISRDCEDDV